MLLTSVACSDDRTDTSTFNGIPSGVPESADGLQNYVSKVISLPDDNTLRNNVVMVKKYNGLVYVAEWHCPQDSVDNGSITLYKLDDDYNVAGATEIQAEGVSWQVCDIYNDQIILSSAAGIISLYDIETGEAIKHITVSPNDHIKSVISVSDGIIVATEFSLYKYDSEMNLTGTIDLETQFTSEDGLWEEDGELFLLSFDDRMVSLLDFASGRINNLFEWSSIAGECVPISGRYLGGEHVIRKLDILNHSVVTIIDLDNTDIMPMQGEVNGPHEYMIADDDLIAIKCTYLVGKSGLQFLIPGENTHSGATEIVIGTLGVNQSDFALQNAVYRFNQEHSDYHVRIEDYGAIYNPDYSSYPDQPAKAEELAMLDLIRYFNSGHEPDIFCGDRFDYEMMGHSGLVTDLIPIMENDSSFSSSEIYSSVYNAMTSHGHCYSVFAGYMLEGYWCLTSDIGDPDVSVSELLARSSELGIRPVQYNDATQLAYDSIAGGRYDYAERMTDGHIMSETDIATIVDYAVTYGLTDLSDARFVQDMNASLDDRSFLASTGTPDSMNVFAPDYTGTDISFTFIGYPCAFGSVHSIRPDSICAISSDSDKKEICWELIKLMLSEDFQREYVNTSGRFPVNSVVTEDLLNNPQYTDTAREDLRRTVDSIDTVYMSEFSIWNILMDEIGSYYSQGRPVDEIARTLQSRLDLYIQENYG